LGDLRLAFGSQQVRSKSSLRFTHKDWYSFAAFNKVGRGFAGCINIWEGFAGTISLDISRFDPIYWIFIESFAAGLAGIRESDRSHAES